MAKRKNRFSVWVGGVEVNDYLLSYDEAKKLAQDYINDGYPGVTIDDYDA